MTPEPPPAPGPDVTDGRVDLGGSSVAVPPVTTSVLTRVRALWCAFVSGLG
jgi:hypothetical protein